MTEIKLKTQLNIAISQRDSLLAALMEAEGDKAVLVAERDALKAELNNMKAKAETSNVVPLEQKHDEASAA